MVCPCTFMSLEEEHFCDRYAPVDARKIFGEAGAGAASSSRNPESSVSSETVVEPSSNLFITDVVGVTDWCRLAHWAGVPYGWAFGVESGKVWRSSAVFSVRKMSKKLP
jgi:hypothetical protein